MERKSAERLLQAAVRDEKAFFRKGQWEAIDALVNRRKRLIVVQRTGWGKSSVYFISTRILRDQGAGPTLIVSPLLALMRNQVEAAGRLGIRADSINSANTAEWKRVEREILHERVDAILVSPERLSNENFVQNVLLPMSERIGLLVVDEAHCISDWGHDFRPDYRRLVNVMRQLPENVPVLGTTATANNRVIEDIQSQLGDIEIQRGSLVRSSLSLQVLRLPDQAARMAWLAAAIPELPGSGIVYALTVRDVEQVARWLNEQGVKAATYHGTATRDGFRDSNEYRQAVEQDLLGNRVKVVVATTALGMGFDKPDLGFVIHYQAPGSIVTYYQQVGRAGRALDSAYGVVLTGTEDARIHEFFRSSAFPAEDHVEQILAALEESDGLSKRDLEVRVNLRQGQIEKVLKVLSVESPAPLIKAGDKWHRTPVEYQMDHERIQRLSHQREKEWREVVDYIDSEGCLMAYLQESLDDPAPKNCGKCGNCIGHPVVDVAFSTETAAHAARFIKKAEMPLKPKKQAAAKAFPQYGFPGVLPPQLRAEEGRVLSRWGDAGYGANVAHDKRKGKFRDELVAAAEEMLTERWRPDPAPEWVTCVPSGANPSLVPDFARRLAARLHIPFLEVVEKVRHNEPQKMQQNRFHQCRNLDGVFSIRSNCRPSPVLLVDDICDSGWTMAVVAALLRNGQSGAVWPLALASTAGGD